MAYQPEPVPAEVTPAYIARELRRIADELGRLGKLLAALEERVDDLESTA